MSEYAWRGLQSESLERLNIEVGETGVAVRSVVDSEHGRFAYELACGPDWTFRSLRVEPDDGGAAVTLQSDGRGDWIVDGEWRSDLSDAIDVDVAASPFTNTLPIRRLALDVEESEDLVVAYISFPGLEVTADSQRYTRLDATTYRFESLDSDFVRDITVDRDGLVLQYEGLFERS